MASVDVSINGRSYQIACENGEEERLSRLAEYVDERVQDLVVAVGQAGDARLLVMASLLIADELYEAQRALDQHGIDGENGATDAGAANGSAVGDGGNGGGKGGGDDRLVSVIEAMADRIEVIAAGIERR
jgi:cell division protein ZapA